MNDNVLHSDHLSIPRFEKQNGVNCLYTNTDILHNKLEELETYIDKNNIDLIAITETLPKHADESYTPIFVLNGYKCFLNNEGRGVAIFVKENIECSRLENYEKLFSPSVFLKLKLPNMNHCIFGNIYRSPNATDKENDKLNEQITKIADEHLREKLVLVGDFNFPDIDWAGDTCHKGDNHKASKFLECLHFNHLSQFISEPTHHRGTQSPTLIDLILSNDDDLVQNIVHYPPLGKSHHSLIYFNIDMVYSKPTESPVLKYQMDKGDFDKMRQFIGNIDWDRELDENLSRDEWGDLIVGKMEEAKELYVPKKFFKKNYVKRTFSAPDSLISALRLKRKCFKQYKKHPTQRNHEAYVFYRNAVNKEVKKAKRKKERKVAKESKLNPKALYQYIASRTKPREAIPNLDKPDGTQTTNDAEKVNVLNNFFKSVYTQEGDTPVPDFDMNVNNTLSQISISKNDLALALKSLNEYKSAGPDRIHPRMLKELADQIAIPLHKLFLRSLSEGKILTKWKEQEIVPIFKKGKKSDPGNYRPVSLTSVICKVFEGFVRTALYKHLIDNGLLSSKQFGFCKGRSCLTQLLVTIDEWMSSLDKGIPVDAAYLDFKKAFDSVPHQRLICKLKGYGIDGHLLDWISDFLSGRTQYVTINGTSSEKVSVTSGVPQGSVLGPTLFIYYINDLPSVANTPTRIFADDTKSYNQIEVKEDSVHLQTCINSLIKWSYKWLLFFNCSKCNMMHLGKNNPCYEYTTSAEEQINPLNVTVKEKDLGVYVDPLLNFNEHITTTIRKARGVSGLILRTLDSRCSDILCPLFLSMVRPVLEYANPVWCPYLRKDIDRIERVQRHFTKRISGLNKLSYTERLKALDLPSLEYRRARGDMVECYKITHEIYDPLTTYTLFELDTNKTTRAHPFKI